MARDNDGADEMTIDVLTERARKLIPVLKERAAETEEIRKTPEKTMEDLHNSGLLKYYQPKRFGGYELDWGAHAYTSTELARGCGSTAWVQCVVGCHTWMAARFPMEAQEEIFDCPEVLIATAFAGGRNISVRKVDGGYKLSGEWAFASGLPNSEWSIVGTQTDEDRLGQFDMTLFAIPKKDWTEVDNWYVSGLRGTGSMNLRVEDIFIPDHRTTKLSSYNEGSSKGAAAHESYIYRVNMPAYFFTVPLGPILGTAIGAMETYLEITKGRVGAMFGEKIAEQIPVQTRISESSVEIASAKLLYGRLFQELHERGTEGKLPSKSEQVRHKRDCTYVGHQCHNATDRLVKMMGASGLSDSNTVQRYFRDMRALVAHQSQQWEVGMTSYGRYALGLETGDELIDGAHEDEIRSLF